MKLRFAHPDDATKVLAIYAQYMPTPITFEYTLPDVSEFAERIRTISQDYPYLLCEEDGEILGYAYAHRARERAAYQWSAELSVYLDARHTARRLGTHLYATLMAMLALQGVNTVLGCVTTPNARSEALHAAMGFTRVGTCHKAGYKNGAWHDVTWFEKAIAPFEENPLPLRSIRELPLSQLETLLATF